VLTRYVTLFFLGVKPITHVLTGKVVIVHKLQPIRNIIVGKS